MTRRLGLQPEGLAFDSPGQSCPPKAAAPPWGQVRVAKQALKVRDSIRHGSLVKVEPAFSGLRPVGACVPAAPTPRAALLPNGSSLCPGLLNVSPSG